MLAFWAAHRDAGLLGEASARRAGNFRAVAMRVLSVALEGEQARRSLQSGALAFNFVRREPLVLLCLTDESAAPAAVFQTLDRGCAAVEAAMAGPRGREAVQLVVTGLLAEFHPPRPPSAALCDDAAAISPTPAMVTPSRHHRRSSSEPLFGSDGRESPSPTRGVLEAAAADLAVDPWGAADPFAGGADPFAAGAGAGGAPPSTNPFDTNPFSTETETEPKPQPATPRASPMRTRAPSMLPQATGIILDMDYSGMEADGEAEAELLHDMDGQVRSSIRAQIERVGTMDDLYTVLYQFSSVLMAIPLPAARAVDRRQAEKDAARESLTVNGQLFREDVEGFLQALREAVAPFIFDADVLDTVVSDILRASSRTASGGDSYAAVVDLFSKQGVLVTPAQRESSPIAINVDHTGGNVTISCASDFSVMSERALEEATEGAPPESATCLLHTELQVRLSLLEHRCRRSLSIACPKVAAAPRAVKVVRAGTAVTNGVFTASFFRNDAPLYANEAGVHVSRELIGGAWGWVIGKPPHAYYAQANAAQAPPEDGWDAHAGEAPVPTVLRVEVAASPLPPGGGGGGLAADVEAASAAVEAASVAAAAAGRGRGTTVFGLDLLDADVVPTPALDSPRVGRRGGGVGVGVGEREEEEEEERSATPAPDGAAGAAAAGASSRRRLPRFRVPARPKLGLPKRGKSGEGGGGKR